MENNRQNKIKPLMPTLREKKRYMLFDIISDKKFTTEDIVKAINKVKEEFFGKYICSKVGLLILKNKIENNKGIIRVNRKFVNHAKVMLSMITKIKDNDAIVRTIKVSGILKKCQ